MKPPRRSRILPLVLLVIAAVVVWSLVIFQPQATQRASAQPNRRPTTGHAAVTISTRALEVLQIPFLVTRTPKEASSSPTTVTISQRQPTVATAVLPKTPPNPFVPLPKLQTAPVAGRRAQNTAPVQITPPRERADTVPIPKVTQPSSPLPTPTPATLAQGSLPLTLSPLSSVPASGRRPIVEAKPAILLPKPTPARPAALVQESRPLALSPLFSVPASGRQSSVKVKPAILLSKPVSKRQPSVKVKPAILLPKSVSGSTTQLSQAIEISPKPASGTRLEPLAIQPSISTPTTPAQVENPLQSWAKQEQLKLTGVALGPTSVAIFQTKQGYIALPVGETFPNKDVLLKTVSAKQVLLMQGPYSLTLSYKGGEQ